MTAPVTVGEIAARLAERADSLARELLPKGRRAGAEWVEARKAAGGLGDSLAVRVAGERRGVWFHGAAGRSGDALDLVAYLATGDDKGRALAWARAWLGLDTTDPKQLETERRRLAEQEAGRASAEAAEREKRARAAFALWLRCRETIEGTPAETYLEGRGIDFDRLGRFPRCLRFAPALRDPESGRVWPALVAAITATDGRTISVHRTYLEVRGDGRVVKAPLANPKKVYTAYRGGAIRVWRGWHCDPVTGEVKGWGRPLRQLGPGAEICLTEGIEDALTLAMIKPHWRIWSTIAIANMAALDLPAAIGTVRIMADNDAPGSPAARALERAAQHFHHAGKRVVFHRLAGVKDLNEALQKRLSPRQEETEVRP